MLNLNSKGQEEAPFELLVSVIIMGFVIAVGFMAMNELAKKQCDGQMDKTMQELKRTLELVSKGQGRDSFSFRMPSCYSDVKSRLIIESSSETMTCNDVCGGSRFDCTFLQFYGVSDGSSHISRTCIDIPPATYFPTDEPGSPCDPSKYSASGNITYEVVSWKEKQIQPGDYMLANEYSLLSDYPVICVYKRKIG